MSTPETDIISDACSLAASNVPANVLFGCSIVATFCEELTREDRMVASPLSSSRRRELLQLLQSAVPLVVESVAQAITVSAQAIKSYLSQCQGQDTDNYDVERPPLVQRAGLRCIEAVLSFAKSTELRVIDVSSAMSVDLLRTIFLVIDLVNEETNRSFISSSSFFVIDFGAAALGCVTEAVSRACWSSGQTEQFVMELATRPLVVLSRQSAIMENLSASQRPGHAVDCALNFRSQLTHFLDSFCENQFVRTLRLSSSINFSIL